MLQNTDIIVHTIQLNNHEMTKKNKQTDKAGTCIFFAFNNTLQKY